MLAFHGLSAFPLTPADPDGVVDTEALCRLIDPLVAAGVDSIGLLGSTGTYAYLDRAQRRRAVQAARETIAGHTMLIIGISALRTDAAQDLARDAEAAGADGVLLAAMSYTPLTEAEVFAHGAAVAGATALPVCLYDNPSTTHFAFSDALIARLAALPGIVAAKLPAPPPEQAAGRIAALRGVLPEGFAIGVSADWLSPAAVLAGADAWYSVVAGLLPRPALALMRAAQAADHTEVARIDGAFAPLWALFRQYGSLRVMVEAARQLGLADTAAPLPILPLASDACSRIGEALSSLHDALAGRDDAPWHDEAPP